MVKLIVSDVDGTLVGDGQGEGALDPAYFEEIKRLQRKGIHFMVCSGRQRVSVQKLFRPICDVIYCACDGGSIVYNPQGEVIYTKALEKDTAISIMKDAAQLEMCDMLVCGTKGAYCREKDSEMYRWMVEGYGYDLKAMGNDIYRLEDDIVKVSVYHKTKAEELTDVWFRPKWQNEVKLSLAGIQWLDCVAQDAGKAGAVSFMQQHLGIKKEETIVFGDNQNDMEMFELAKESYAVRNARDEIKKAATSLCDSYEQNGVLKILRNL